MGVIARDLPDELANFAQYSRAVAADVVGPARDTWLARAEWADACAAAARGAVEALREIKARCDQIVAGEFGGLRAARDFSEIAGRAIDAAGGQSEQPAPVTAEREALVNAIVDVLIDEERGSFGPAPSRVFVAGVIVDEAVKVKPVTARADVETVERLRQQMRDAEEEMP